MSVDELLSFLKDNQKQLIQQIKDGKYKTNPVRRVEIPKETKGEFRKLKELGMDENFIQWHANMRQGIWNCSNNRMVKFALNNAKLREWGYPTFTEFYLKICEN